MQDKYYNEKVTLITNKFAFTLPCQRCQVLNITMTNEALLVDLPFLSRHSSYHNKLGLVEKPT